MSGTWLLGLILLSMAWLLFFAGIALKVGKAAPARLGFLPGASGSLAAFFTIPALAQYGVEVPWPWLWILLPLAIDLTLARAKTK